MATGANLTESSTPRVAYLLLAHHAPEQLLRLVQVLPPDSPVFVHFDGRAAQPLYEQAVALLKARPNVRFVERHVCRWGAWGIVAATLSLVRGLVASGAQYDYATLLSGADYPIKSNAEIAAFLAQHAGREFIESFPILEPNRWTPQGGLFKAPERVLGWHVRFRSRVWRLPFGLRTLPLGMKPYGGSQWWTLSRRAVEYLDRFVREHPEVPRFCQKSFIPDESFVQIVLSNSPFAADIVSDDLRVVIWGRPQPPYPATLFCSDLPELLASPKLFARKFDARQDSQVLDRLDERNGHAAPRVAAAAS